MNVMEPEESINYIRNPHAVFTVERKLSPARNVLLNYIFLGHYEERRYVVQLKEYRDVVTISPAESQLKMDLDTIIKDLRGVHGIKWLGITIPEAQCSKPVYSLWVKFKDVPFGHFWFQIKQIKYEHEEVILRLKCLRPFRPEDYEVAHKDTIPKSEDSNNSDDPTEYSFDFDPGLKITMLYAMFNDTFRKVGPHLTWNNCISVSKFIFAVAFVLISALFTAIRHFGEYFLRLFRELTLLLNVLTPVFVQVIDCFTKIIGGAFILITLMIRGRGTQQLQYQFQPQPKTISYYQSNVPQLMPARSEKVSGFFGNLVNRPSNWREREIRN